MDDQDTDFIATALLSELKNENERKSGLIRGLIRVILGCVIALVATVAGFLYYLNQYDFTSYSDIEASGVYTLVDSNGNIVAQDLTSEELEQLMEVVHGSSTSSEAQIED